MTEIAREYGTALFMLACEENCKKEIAAGLDTMRDAFLQEPEYGALLASPAVPLAERLESARAAFGGTVHAHALSFLQLLCEKGRIGFFTECVEVYHALLDASEHRSHAKVTSAVPLDKQERDKLLRKLSDMCGGEVSVEYSVDAALLGGFVVEVDGKIMDASGCAMKIATFISEKLGKNLALLAVILSCAVCGNVTRVVFRVALGLVGMLVLLVYYYHSEIG